MEDNDRWFRTRYLMAMQNDDTPVNGHTFCRSHICGRRLTMVEDDYLLIKSPDSCQRYTKGFIVDSPVSDRCISWIDALYGVRTCNIDEPDADDACDVQMCRGQVTSHGLTPRCFTHFSSSCCEQTTLSCCALLPPSPDSSSGEEMPCSTNASDLDQGQRPNESMSVSKLHVQIIRSHGHPHWILNAAIDQVVFQYTCQTVLLVVSGCGEAPEKAQSPTLPRNWIPP
jgi:hypothetical protein